VQRHARPRSASSPAPSPERGSGCPALEGAPVSVLPEQPDRRPIGTSRGTATVFMTVAHQQQLHSMSSRTGRPSGRHDLIREENNARFNALPIAMPGRAGRPNQNTIPPATTSLTLLPVLTVAPRPALAPANADSGVPPSRSRRHAGEAAAHDQPRGHDTTTFMSSPPSGRTAPWPLAASCSAVERPS